MKPGTVSRKRLAVGLAGASATGGKACAGGRAKDGKAHATATPAQTPVVPQDAFIAQAVAIAPSANMSQQLAEQQMPNTRVESYRFTDLRPLLSQQLQRPPAADIAAASEVAGRCEVPDCACAVIVDGHFQAEASSLSALPEGVVVSTAASSLPTDSPQEPHQALERGGVFAHLNHATTSSRLFVHVPEGVQCHVPLHLLYISSSAGVAGTVVASSPQVLVSAGKGASIEVIEEFVGQQQGAGRYYVNAVLEAALAEGAEVSHRVVETEEDGAFHMKGTFVSQAEKSTYSLVEARLGGALTRHDVSVRQDGPETSTFMRHFLLCGAHQLHDLHTSLRLDHPNGIADQLHKCIVSESTGHGVFDGNVQVNKFAQLTDAGQLSRNLLLAPKATVNVKPNLQIIADDVKCTHGCAVSDLSADEMFYFRSRGIDAATARRALVVSFGAEVMQQMGHDALMERMQASVRSRLADVV